VCADCRQRKRTISQSTSSKPSEQLDPVKNSIAIAGLFIPGCHFRRGDRGIMNITFVSVKERTKEIGTRKALALATNDSVAVLIESTAFVSSVIYGLRPRFHDVFFSLAGRAIVPDSTSAWDWSWQRQIVSQR